MPPKRKRQDGGEDVGGSEGLSIRKRVRAGQLNGSKDESEDAPDPLMPAETLTPTKTRRGRPPGSGQKRKPLANGVGSENDAATPLKPKGKKLFSTPSKAPAKDDDQTDGPIIRNADRSARRKSARTLLDRTATNGLSDEDDFEDDDLLARKIWDADEAESDDQQEDLEDELAAESAVPATPSKRKRGRRKRSPTPPLHLPPHEQYFWQNRPGKVKTSNNTLSSLSLLTHEQYHNAITAYSDPHSSSYTFLHTLHSRSFPQWRFELSQSFNICLYGYGSKRNLLTSFASHLHALTPSNPPKILVVNGYTPTLTLRHLLTSLAILIYNLTPTTLPPLGTQPREILTTLLSHLTTHPPPHPYHIFINSLDAPPLRRAPTPSLLALLASNPHIHLLATCDTPNFPLLWPTTLLAQYNFLFHDTTTFLPYTPHEIPSAIDSVNALLGRSGRSIKGKEGVGFVLRSLPENARSLYRVLISEILAGWDEEGGGEGGGLGGVGAGGGGGVEYKVLYQKVVEEFICSNEMGFRGLLKEFFDHQMVVSRKDGSGGEVLGVPWRREEMEAILEDLVA